MRKLLVNADFSDKREYGGVGYYRSVVPSRYLEDCDQCAKLGNLPFFEKKSFWKKRIKPNPKNIEKYLSQNYDTFHLQYNEKGLSVDYWLALRDLYNKKLIIDIDDNIFTADELNTKNVMSILVLDGTEYKTNLICLFKFADALTVTNSSLRKLYSKLNKNIYICPNYIDLKDWDFEPNVIDHSGKIKIGFAGGSGHHKDLVWISPVIRKILKKYPNVIWVNFGHDSKLFNDLGDKFEFYDWTYKVEDWIKLLKNSNLDIAIAPIKDISFNRYKSPIKWLEYSMCKVPCVASGFYGSPYREVIKQGVNGFLADSKIQFEKYLSLLIESKELRSRIGTHAYSDTISNYSIQNNIDKWNFMYSEVAKQERKILVPLTEEEKVRIKELKKGVKFVPDKVMQTIIKLKHKLGGDVWNKEKKFSEVVKKGCVFPEFLKRRNE